MANVKISALPSAGAITGAEEVPMVQGGVTVKGVVKNFGIVTVKKTISSAEILNSFTSPITLVAAPGASKIIQVVSSFIVGFNWNSIAYATNTAASIGYYNAFLFTIVSDVFFSYTGDGSFYYPTTSVGTSNLPATRIVNCPLVFQTKVGNPTAGNSTLTIYTTYTIIDA